MKSSRSFVGVLICILCAVLLHSQTKIVQGAQGPRGFTGARGPAATVTVGTVNSGDVGSAPVVTNVGTSSQAIFNFTIPRGSQMFSGSGVPTTVGANGDWYFRTDTGCLYGPKTGGGWSGCTSLIGPAGIGADSSCHTDGSGNISCTSGTFTTVQSPQYCIGASCLTGWPTTRTVYRTCELHLSGTGVSGVLLDIDDEAASCYNGSGVTETVTGVKCWADAGSPTVLPVVTGGSNLLSGNLTCGTASFAAGTLNGTPTLASGSTIDANIITAGGTAKSIRLAIILTRIQ